MKEIYIIIIIYYILYIIIIKNLNNLFRRGNTGVA